MARGRRPILVTGGAGFIGSNLADRLCTQGHDVLVFDALLRPGVAENLEWLQHRHPRRLSVSVSDMRDRAAVEGVAAEASAVFHLAGQVAVTTSMMEPETDFDINVRGTVMLLEALRRRALPPPLIFASTNKVYGNLLDVALIEGDDRYVAADARRRDYGIDELQALDFHTPYGCSKGAADQYVLDYARSFGVPTAVLRMSCIYGRRQRGTEDQGWLAHFVLRARAGAPITIYGNGKQVRDVLWIDDAVDAYIAAWQRIGIVQGTAFNLGGGPANTVSLLQVTRELRALMGQPIKTVFEDWRPGDQRYFVADARRAAAALGLNQPLGWRDGLARLVEWFAVASREAVAAQ